MTRPQPRPRGPRPAADESVDPIDTSSRSGDVVTSTDSPASAPATPAVLPVTPGSAPARQREGQIPLNVALPTSVFTQLDELVMKTGKTKKTLIADLITTAYHAS